MQIIYEPAKALQAKLKHETVTVPAHNAEIKAYNWALARRMFFLIAPSLSAVFFVIYFIFYMAITGNWAIGSIISENHLGLIVFAGSLAITEGFALFLFFLLRDDDWWIAGPDNYSAAVKYHLAVESDILPGMNSEAS